jgi:hypothetical protein
LSFSSRPALEKDSFLQFKSLIMEDLFSTNIAVNNQNINYRVIFDEEKYVFVSEAEQREFPSFSFRREHDRWMDQELLPPEIKTQAVEALDRYLLKQH